MKILALEFSSPQRSVALVEGLASSGWSKEQEAVETGSGASKPFELIDQVLRSGGVEREQVERVVVGLGPGSYTGIRAAIALAQGWQLGRQTPVQGISSVEALAAQAHADRRRGPIAVVIDAQRGEFYLAEYELSDNGYQPLTPLRLVAKPVVAETQAAGALLVGPEINRWFSGGAVVFPRAVTLAKLAGLQPGSLPGEALEPIYLRPTSFVKAPPPRILPGDLG